MFPKGNMMAGLLQQAKQVQDKIEALQGELAGLRVEGQAGGGMVTAVVNGQQELISVSIDPQMLGEDVELLEDLVVAAVRQATDKSKEESQRRFNAVTGGMMGGLNVPEL
ncbi:MAG: YbaB/EbfC family nucleoid-associated protein [Candidatus Marinimicrobia bacterium]|nr:YbaB/EbfC family nucleoid-associated protein [Candidatus Neomarinimicrobiota bacterium]